MDTFNSSTQTQAAQAAAETSLVLAPIAETNTVSALLTETTPASVIPTATAVQAASDTTAALSQQSFYDAQVAEAEYLDTSDFNQFPPIFKQFVDIAPEGFEEAVVLSLLPLLGTVGSRLRACYLDNRLHSPSFMVCIEGESQSGKSFIRELSEQCLRCIKTVDDIGHEQENEYREKQASYERIVGRSGKGGLEAPKDPKPIIRIEPVSPSISKLMLRMKNADMLHLVTVTEEVDAVMEALKKSCSNYTVIMRCAFDNSAMGQDYMKVDTFSGSVDVFWNMLYSGTPGQVERFFNAKSVENGTCSRFIITHTPTRRFTLPPVWKKMSKQQTEIVETGLQRLNDITIQCLLQRDEEGNEHLVYVARDEHVMDLHWLVSYLRKFETELLAKAKACNDRRLDRSYMRPVTIGFRAGMLAFYLYGEKDTPAIRKKVCAFARWVACVVLNNYLDYTKNVKLSVTKANYPELYAKLPNQFTREQLEEAKRECKIGSATKLVLFKWRSQDKSITKTDDPNTFIKITNHTIPEIS